MTTAQFVMENVARSAVLKPAVQGWITFNVAGNPKTSTRAIRRKLARLERRDAGKGGAQ
jgi:hypothetical protein